MITINVEKAKEIKKSRIREERNPLLAQLDVEFMKAVEMGDIQKQQEIALKKQELRDITKHESLLNASTVEELKALNLEKLLNKDTQPDTEVVVEE